jgi:PAS domain S-box-containing protein
MNLLDGSLGTSGLIPHGFCYQWKGGLVWLHAASDALIALAYFTIPCALMLLARKRRDVPFHWMFVCFAVFILGCGTTHAMEVLTLWVPAYRVSGAVKAVTALASVPTAAFLMRMLPQAMELPSPAQLRAANEELRKQSESLRQSQQRFQQMAENIREIFWVMDAETKAVTYVSPAFEQICELPAAFLKSEAMSYMKLIHAQDGERILKALDRMAEGQGFDEEFRIVCPNGKVKWLRSIASPVKDETGRIATFVGTAQDVTVRKEMEANLRESEDRYRDLVEHSTDLICTHTLDGRLLSVNELPAKVLGYTKEELLNRPMSDLLLPEARAEFEEALIKLKKEGFVKGLMVVVTKSGKQRIWEYHNTLRTEGVAPPIARGVAHDVTEQKRMERELRRSEEKFAKAFLASPHGIAITTLNDGRIVDVNRSLLEMAGLRSEQVIGRTAGELGIFVSPREREEIVAEIRKTGRVRARQVVLQKPAGDHLIIKYVAETIELGGRKCLLSVCEDVTEHKRAEARLLEYEKAVEGLEEMIAVVDREYRYLLANQAFLRYRNMTRSEVVGRFVYEVLDKTFFEQVAKPRMDEAFAGKAVKYETKYSYPGIGERDVAISYFPVDGAEGVDRLACVVQDVTDRKRANEELHRLSGRLLQMQDEERRKIARNLHDSTGQELVALATTLSQVHEGIPAERRKLRRQVAQCRWIADRTLREVRTLSYLLHPPLLDQWGLEDAVRHFVAGFRERTGIAVDLEVSRAFGRLPEDIELGLFRVVQESLTNIHRHSGSLRAKINLRREQGRVLLQVSDEGRGIASKNGSTNGACRGRYGVGIPSMEERAKQVGGELLILSSHHGTSVQLSVPIHA